MDFFAQLPERCLGASFLLNCLTHDDFIPRGRVRLWLLSHGSTCNKPKISENDLYQNLQLSPQKWPKTEKRTSSKLVWVNFRTLHFGSWRACSGIGKAESLVCECSEALSPRHLVCHHVSCMPTDWINEWGLFFCPFHWALRCASFDLFISEAIKQAMAPAIKQCHRSATCRLLDARTLRAAPTLAVDLRAIASAVHVSGLNFCPVSWER